MPLLALFIGLQLVKFLLEKGLAIANRRYYENPQHQTEACQLLAIPAVDFQKTLAYSNDKYRFASRTSTINLLLFLAFLGGGGFGWLESLAREAAHFFSAGSLVTGLAFFGLLGLLSLLWSLPFDYYATFGLEEKHGFNRQTRRGFFFDRLKGLLLGALFGGGCLAGILWVMESSGEHWWLWAWLFFSAFQLLTLWLYPSVLAPLFNKFRPLEEGPLKSAIYNLAAKVAFNTSGIFVMDASRRSSHGNAYFTGIGNRKRIVLFDTLLQSMGEREIVAVLAHELGHFKLKHVFWGLVRGLATFALLFYSLSLCLPLESFYHAFSLEGVSTYGALLVFFLWFDLLAFLTAPLASWLSRRNEFAADAFARKHLGNSDDLAQALLKLREANHAMPISHPWYSTVYHSHPPLMERLKALKA